MNQEPAKEKVEVFVAKVNSDNITRDYYNGYCQTQYRLSVVDAESIEDFKKFNDEDRLKLLNSLINYVLLLQDAKKRNLVVSKEELSKQLSSFAKKFKSKAEMQTFLSERKLVMDNLTNEATRNIITGKIITEVVPNLSEKMKITEQDVKEFYNENREKFGDKSPSEIKDRLVMMVKNARRRTLLNEFFENLRKNAEVQIYEDKL
ncbi:MAG: SurA N-terminal domain-containing protein [Nitrospinota bacterium]